VALHMQLSFQVYFNRSISLGKEGSYDYSTKKKIEINSFLIADSPWDIIVLQYDKIYDTKLCKNIPGARGGWSVAACTAYIPGIIFGKPFNKCNYDEIIIELWAQMYRSKSLQECVMKNNGCRLEKSLIVKWSPMWPTYKFDDTTQTLTTEEPKFTNNAGTYTLRPSFKTHIDNLFIATAYVKETIDIFSMEAASIAGKYVAHAISEIDRFNIRITAPLPVMVDRPMLLVPFRALDSISYKLGLPNISILIIIVIVIIIILFLWSKLKKVRIFS